jgi:hypothetical protein
MGTNWNDFSESEKAAMRSRASSIRDEAASRREECEARAKSDKGSFLDKFFSALFGSMERTANNISKRR